MAYINPTDLLSSSQTALDNYDGVAPAVLLEVYHDGLSVNDARGLVDKDGDEPATSDRPFQIASQTKMMTATVLLQLASEGELSLEDKLADVMDISSLQGIPNIENVTLQQLMLHSSGIPDYDNDLLDEDGNTLLSNMIAEDPERPIGFDEYIQLLLDVDMPAHFEPGTQTKYSNTGYMLLEMAMESITGNTLAEEFQTRIFDPLGMTSSSLPGYDRPGNILSSYVDLGDELFDVTHIPQYSGGIGGVVSTTGDMTRFMNALVLENILVPEDQSEALEQFFIAAGDSPDGWVGHAGGALGTVSATFINLETGIIVSFAETVRTDDPEEGEIFGEFVNLIFNNPSWVNFENDGTYDFALTAADLDVSEIADVDGSPQTLLAMGKTFLRLDDGLSDLDTSTLNFEDNSVLHITDADGGKFSVLWSEEQAADANNQLLGQGGDDWLKGGWGDDKIIGGGGDDKLIGLKGDDRIEGGIGDDHLNGGWGNDVLNGGEGDDRILGGKGQDTLMGGEGDDVFLGGRGNDIMEGGLGDDVLQGGSGNDILKGGEGNDVLLGGRGADTFIFTQNSGRDQIFCFENGTDKVDLSAFDLTFEDLTIDMEWCDLISTVSFDGDEIWFVNPSQSLTADDFIF